MEIDEEKLIRIIKANTPQPEKQKSFLEHVNFNSVIQSLMAAAIIGFYVKFDAGKENDIKQNATLESVKEDIAEIKKDVKEQGVNYGVFSAYPRYTNLDSENDFKSWIKPYENRTTTLENIVNERKGFMEETRREIQNLKVEFSVLESEIKD